MVAAILAIILTLILVVGIHEAGHGLVARFFSIKIQKISIGFGKPLLSWTNSKGTEWIWATWPLGGYVQLQNTRISAVNQAEIDSCFDKKPIWQRFLVLISGSLFNLITAWLLFFLILMIGMKVQKAEISSVTPHSIAAQAGIKSQDQWLAIHGKITPSWQEVGMQLIRFWGQDAVPILVKQPDGQERQLMLNLNHVEFSGKEKSLLSLLGIEPNAKADYAPLPVTSFGSAMYSAFVTIKDWICFFLTVLKQLVTGVIPFSALLGPLGLFTVSVATFTQGLLVFMYFIASLSVAVALVNLFPIPGLDGGSILYLFIEKVRGEPLSVALEVLIYRLVQIAFALLLVQLILNDVQRFYA